MSEKKKGSTGLAIRAKGKAVVSTLRQQVGRLQNQLRSGGEVTTTGDAMAREGTAFSANAVTSALSETELGKSSPVPVPLITLTATLIGAFVTKRKARKTFIRLSVGNAHSAISHFARRIPAALKEAAK